MVQIIGLIIAAYAFCRRPSMNHADDTMDRLKNRVQAQLTGRVRDLRLHQESSGIVLYGYASSYYAKQLAQHAVMRETEVPIAANEIEVL